MSRVLVTGGTGFIGVALCEHLARCGYLVRAALRAERPLPHYIGERVLTGELNSRTDWRAALEGVDVVVHAAARAHVLKETQENAKLYAETNARGTQCLARAAAQAGVRRFVFLSSIKVNGAQTHGRAFRADDEPQPADSYGRSKLEGEAALRRASAASDMEFAIVRSPLVYGPGVRANFLRLMHWVERGRALPFGAINNRRSLVSVWNLVDLIGVLLRHPRAHGKVWLVSDGEDLSTPELIRRLARALDRCPRLLAVAPQFLRLGARLGGRRAELERLCGSLVVDVSPTNELLQWSAPLTVDEALARTAAWYRSTPH